MFRHFCVAPNATQTTKQGFEMGVLSANFEGLVGRCDAKNIDVYKRSFIMEVQLHSGVAFLHRTLLVSQYRGCVGAASKRPF